MSRFFSGSLYVKIELLEGSPLEQWRKMIPVQKTRKVGERFDGETTFTLTAETAFRPKQFYWPEAPANGVVTSCAVGEQEQLIGEVSVSELVTFRLLLQTVGPDQVLVVKVRR